MCQALSARNIKSRLAEVSERHVFTECGKGTSGNVSGKLLLV
ncbi:hypothetical protein D024_2349 [Vibrio parahaemolyticus 3259]|nr:hypothetical protein D024_2349 [Vibrio parahaemolyticus 3259]ETJ88959.1 hypothetical protein D041_3595 [Vibrio parahaemolyticus EKP-008]